MSFAVFIFGNTEAMRVIFSFKMFKNGYIFQDWKKKFRKYYSLLRYVHLNWLFEILTIRQRIRVIGSQCIGKVP